MCKIMTIIGIRDVSPKKLKSFLKVAAFHLTSQGDMDGFGYVGLSPKGMFGERWLNFEDAFRLRSSSTKDSEVVKDLGNTVMPVNAYNSFGTVDISKANSLLLHARASTNSISLDNTHPFVEGNLGIIHNGIIDAETVKNETSTCDSELILRLLIKYDVVHHPANLNVALDELNGYWACASLALNDVQWIVDVFKDSKAELCYAEIEELGKARVYCTSSEILLSITKAMRFGRPRIFKVKADTHVRFDAVTGKTLLTQELDSTCRVYSYDDYKGEGKRSIDKDEYPIGHGEVPDDDYLDEEAVDAEYQRDVHEAIMRNFHKEERRGRSGGRSPRRKGW